MRKPLTLNAVLNEVETILRQASAESDIEAKRRRIGEILARARARSSPATRSCLDAPATGTGPLSQIIRLLQKAKGEL